MPKALEEHSPAQDHAAILRWMNSFEIAVRARDFPAGRALCAHDIFSFGTVTNRAQGIDELESLQWQSIWLVTEGFSFDQSSLHFGAQAGLYWLAAAWSSWGKRDGKPFQRLGRASIILRQAADELLAIHTHFSLFPPPLAVSPVESLRDTGGLRH